MAEAIGADVAWRLARALAPEEGNSQSQVGTATVTRVDADGTVWVRIPGSGIDTPANGTVTAAAEPGQTVGYRIESGRLSVTGNVSSPAVGGTYVTQVVEPVERKADEAMDEAWRAHTAADAAEMDARRAKVAADAAQESADEAADAAESAQQSATTANRAANDALTQLSFVEDVAGTLDWIQSHGTFTATTDTTVREGKVYFELVSGDYVPVATPTGNPSQQGWYELDVTDSQTDYIMAHLAVTSAGLWVLPSGLGQSSGPQVAPGYKLLLAADGARLYDDEGRQVMSYGESITMSSSRPQYIGGEDAYIVYYDADEDGSPDTIRIGGTVLMGGSKTLSEVLAELGQASEDAARARDICTIALTSTNGTVFKQNLGVSTSIVATLFTGDGLRIADAQALRSRYGAGAFLQWRWKDSGTGDFVTISSADPRLSAGGFVLTVSPQDVSTQAVIDCELVY